MKVTLTQDIEIILKLLEQLEEHDKHRAMDNLRQSLSKDEEKENDNLPL